jgi:ParB-like chromosome segregation protein Spo0J
MKMNHSKIHPNPWNPNRITERTRSAISESLETYGQIAPLIVRPHPDIEGDFQIVDGEHRFSATEREVLCNVIEANDEEAKKLTIILNETRGSADKMDLSSLLADLSISLDISELLVGLPFSEQELEELIAIGNYDWDALDEVEEEEEVKVQEKNDDMVKLLIEIKKEDIDKVQQAKDLIIQEKEDKSSAVIWGKVMVELASDYVKRG